MSAPTTPPGGKAATAARIMGKQAAQAGAGIGECPYATDQGGPELTLAMNWVRGYRTVNPHGEDAVAPAETKTWTRAGVTFEVKAKKAGFGKLPGWDEAEHPRDARGRFIEIGARVKVYGGGEGTVRGNLGGGKIDVEFDNGHRQGVHKGWMTVLKRADGSAPTSKPDKAHAAPVTLSASPLPTHVPNVPAGSGSPVWPPPDPAGAELTPAQAQAAKPQHWKTLPSGTIAELQTQLAQAVPADVPSVTELIDQGMSPAEATAVNKKAVKAAYMKAYVLRVKLAAAIDTAIALDAHLPDPLGDLDNELDAAPETPEVPEADTEPAPQVTPEVAADMAKQLAGSYPVALYDALPGTGHGPGGDPDKAWYDRLKSPQPNTDPVPVSGLTVNGHTIQSGWAMRRNDVAYLVERAGDETPEQAIARLEDHIKVIAGVMEQVPGNRQSVLRGSALLGARNPADLPGYTSTVSSDGLGGVTAWNGTPAPPTHVAHEFGDLLNKNLSMMAASYSSGTDWTVAASDDTLSTQGWKDRFVETRQNKFADPIIVTGESVTGIGKGGHQADFAESVRLWLKDKREGKIGYDPTTGDNLRFSDVFPARAAALNALMDADSDGEIANNTPARKRRMKEAEDAVYKKLEAAKDPKNASVPVLGLTKDHGLPIEAALEALDRAENRYADKVKTDEAKAAAEQAVKQAAAEAAKAKADAIKKIASIEEAQEQGLLSATGLDKLRTGRKNAYKRAMSKGMTHDQAVDFASAYEARAVRKWLRENPDPTVVTDTSKPWLTAATTHDVAYNRQAKERDPWADKYVVSGGKQVHPDAEKQPDQRSQAKANIAAELGRRMNNPDDWAKYREWHNAEFGNDPGEFDAPKISAAPSGWYPPKYAGASASRQYFLDQGASYVVATSAANSGDSQEKSIRTQIAAAEEFGLSAHPAPTMDAYRYQMAVLSMKGRRDYLRSLLRHQYDMTQEDFKKEGVTHVTLYRGMEFGSNTKAAKLPTPEWASDGVHSPKFQPINSWSSQWEMARMFGPTIFHAKVPVERIMGSAVTGFGCFTEWEYVVMDGPGTASVVNTWGTNY